MFARLLRAEFWSIIIATLVTMLIWIWAARETRDQRQVVVLFEFVANNPDNWLIETDTDVVRVTVDGSRQAVRQFASEELTPFQFLINADGIPSQPGSYPLDLATLLSSKEIFSERGLAILECEPAAVQLRLDRIKTVDAEVRPVLPGIRIDGERVVSPRTVQISMPEQIYNTYYAYTDTLTLVAEANPTDIDLLVPGQQHTLTLRVAPPDDLAAESYIRIQPPTVDVTFSVRSQIRQTTLDSVRVQLAGPWEDADDYKVEIEPTSLRQVTISGDADLIRRITTESLIVIAFVHVSSRQKEQRITTAPISFMHALVPVEGGGAVGMPVTIELAPNQPMPTVNLTITERAQPPVTPDTD